MSEQYRISVPLMNRSVQRIGRETILHMLQDLGADRVFLALGENSLRNDTHEAELQALKENCAYFQAEGFSVGAWLWTFLVTEDAPFVYMRSPEGKTSASTVCPTDRSYQKAMGAFLREIAKCGVDLIMFDDDYRYGFQDVGFGCVCENHIAMMENLVGETVDLPLLKQQLLAGGANKYRSAFIKANGKALEDFAAAMRRDLDQSAPEVRLGFCSCITSWDLDGTSPDRISRILAGRTKPFYRLIGAPYWAAMRAWGNRLGDVIELERAEAARRKDEEIEIFSEGDTYPRPRFSTPASYLECFDTALRAAGCTDGILKYAVDYSANADYEPGYYDAAMRNGAVYPEIDRLFSGKTCAGVRVYDKADKYETVSIPEHMEGNIGVQEIAFSAAARFLTANSIPSVYEGDGVGGIAFGGDARFLPAGAFQKGLILDAAAAQILREQGIDVGILDVGEAFEATKEIYIKEKNTIGLPSKQTALHLKLSPQAEILSFTEEKDQNRRPLSYIYQNADGACFLVYAFNGYFSDQNWFRGYLRAGQIRQLIEKTGNPLPALCPGHPELYLLVKTNGSRISVGLWNLFADPVYSPEVVFPDGVSVLSAVKCTASADGNRVRLSDIPAFDFALIEVHLRKG